MDMDACILLMESISMDMVVADVSIADPEVMGTVACTLPTESTNIDEKACIALVQVFFELLVFDAECLLCRTEQDYVSRTGNVIILCKLLDVEEDYVGQVCIVCLKFLNIRIVVDVNERCA